MPEEYSGTSAKSEYAGYNLARSWDTNTQSSTWETNFKGEEVKNEYLYNKYFKHLDDELVYLALSEWNDFVVGGSTNKLASTLGLGQNTELGESYKVLVDALKQWDNSSSVWSEDTCTPTTGTACVNDDG